MLEQYSDVQWIWVVLSGFPNEVSWEEIIENSKEYDITEEHPFLNCGLKYIENKAVFELIAMDSSRTIILIDDEKVQDELLEYFPESKKIIYMILNDALNERIVKWLKYILLDTPYEIFRINMIKVHH